MGTLGAKRLIIIVCQVEDYRNMLKLGCRPFAFTSYKAFFKKTKRSLELVALLHFLHDFWRKIFLLIYSITWPNLIVWLPLLHLILGNTWILTGCFNVFFNIFFALKQIKQFFLKGKSPTLNLTSNFYSRFERDFSSIIATNVNHRINIHIHIQRYAKRYKNVKSITVKYKFHMWLISKSIRQPNFFQGKRNISFK